VECSKDAQCGDGYTCENGSCVAGCLRDEQCGSLERCEAARCVARGCITDRECVALLGQRDAECREEECVIPCEDQGGCAAFGPLSSCEEGVCRSVGCERNSDCSALLGGGGALRLCLEAAEADAVRDSDPRFFSVGGASLGL
jgi:hypothetical protein